MTSDRQPSLDYCFTWAKVTESPFSSRRTSSLAWRKRWQRGKNGDGLVRQETNRWAADFMEEEEHCCLGLTYEALASHVGAQCWDWRPWNLDRLYQLGCFWVY